uniref:Uncharacterized protein n=1 Tax=Neogobius melanostomus TaxID=47308 RepID=A0A8C6V248_9GOBI
MTCSDVLHPSRAPLVISRGRCSSPPQSTMAEALFEDFLTCPVCLDPLRVPVTLGCHHSFCRSCLNNSWLKNPGHLCPVCRRRSSKEIVEVNFALRELSLSVSEQKKVKWPKVCSSHPDTPPLFCLEEARALCPVCEFSLHSQHTVVSGEEAERRLKEQVQKQLQALKGQKRAMKNWRRDTTSCNATQRNRCSSARVRSQPTLLGCRGL